MTANEILLLAFRKGYRVLPDGTVQSANGNIRKLTKPKCRTPYYTFNISVKPGSKYPVKVHRLQAYQKFGDAMFEPGILVRHLDENSLNNRPGNLALGTGTDNSMDRDPQARKEHAAKGKQKYSAEFVEKLRSEHASGKSYKALEAEYGVARSTLSYYLSRDAKRTSFTHPQ